MNEDFQRRAGDDGRAFERTVEVLLRIEGWEILERHWRQPECDVEIDFVARSPDGQEWWIEAKGSWEGNRPGLRRTDTLKKAIFNGAMLRLVADRKPYMVVASHPPKGGTAGDIWLERTAGVYVDAVRYVTLLPPVP